MERKMNHKVGIKLLDDIQLENVMPTYKHLFQKIDICREVAYYELQSDEKRHYQYNFMYDNVFSILGQRGTGKTSVVFTLKEKIKRQYHENYDVVLPLIIPEVIPENCTVLGWILAIVREEIEELENTIYKLERKNFNDSTWDRCGYLDIQKETSSLSVLFEELSQLFYAGQYNPSNEASYYRAIDNSVKQAEDYYKFGKKVAELWDAWVKRIQYLQQLEKGKESTKNLCPMIYFIFDDVDLAPEKIEELLSVIIKYLSHPNIIVITTAHEELVLEVIENRLDRSIGRLPKEWRSYLRKGQNNKEFIFNLTREEKDALYENDLISQTARMYLGKVLPTSTRYYLKLFHTAKQKELFCLEYNESLGAGIKNQIQLLIDCIGDKKQINFMEADTGIVNFYLKFIGNTSRQISNVYIALQELIVNLKDIIQNSKKVNETGKERILMQIYQNCRYFLCIAINANHDLSNKVELIDEFVDEVFLPEYNQWKIYCDYSFLNKYLEEKFQRESRQKRIEIGLQLYSLLAFEENILLLLEKGVPNGITKRKKIHTISFLTNYIKKIAFKRDYIFREDLSPNVFFSHYMNLLDCLDIIVTDEMSERKFNIEYFYNFKTYNESCKMKDLKKIYKNNRKWFLDLAGMLTMVYGNAYVISEKEIEECLLYFNRRYLIRYERRIDTEIKNNIRNSFTYIEMQKGNGIVDKLSHLHMILQNQNYISLFFEFVEEVNFKLINEEKDFTTLSNVLDSTFNYMNRYLNNSKEFEEIIQYFPEDILNDIRTRGRDFLRGSENTRSLMLKYIEKITQTSVGQYLILRDVENAIDVLEQCIVSQYVPSDFAIRDICTRILKSAINNNAATLENNIGMELKNLLVNISKNISEGIKENDYWDDEIKLKRGVEELFGDLEVIVEVVPYGGPTEEVKKAVELGMWIVFVKILQRLYISQVVHEKYENGNSMSSKELEKVKQSKGEANTYYYQIFQYMVRLLENDTITVNEKENNLELVDIKKDIQTTYLRERENYVNSLIGGVDNE